MARKKRLNKKMIIILASVVGAVLVIGVVAGLILTRDKDPGIFAERAARYLKDGDYEKAVRNYGWAAGVTKSTHPDKAKYMFLWAETMLEWRRKDDSLGQSQKMRLFGDARGALREAIRYNPGFIKAHRLLGELEFAIARFTKDWVPYIDSINGLLKLIPAKEYPQTLHKRAWAEREFSRTRPEYFKPALRDYLDLIKRAPDQETYWLELAELRGRAEGAASDEDVEKTYQDALQANPDSVAIRIKYAYLLQQQDRGDEALQMLTDAVSLQPDDGQGHRALALYYQRAGDMAQAVKSFNKAIEVDPMDYRAYAMLTRIYVYLKDLDRAKAVLVSGLKILDKEDKDQLEGKELNNYYGGVLVLNYQLCDVLMDQFRSATDSQEKAKLIQATKDSLEKMRSVPGDHPQVSKIQGRLAAADGRPADAEKLLRQAYEAFPSPEPKTAELLIDIYVKMGQPGEAQKIISRYVRNAKGQFNPRPLMALVKLYIGSGQYDRARQLLRNVLRQENTPAEAASLEAGLDAVAGKIDRIPEEIKQLDQSSVQLFLRRARQLSLEGEQEAAIQLAWDIARREPGNVVVISQLIRWHITQGQTDMARSALALAMEAYKDNPAIQKRLKLLVETDPKKLMAEQLEIARSNTDPLRRELRIAMVYRSFRQEKGFIEHLTKAEALNPKSPIVILQMFNYAIGKSDWESARKYAKIAAEANIDTVEGKTYEAQLASARGQWEEAAKIMQEVVGVRPRFSKGHSFLGKCYLASGKIDLAREEYEQAYSQNPSNLDALIGLIGVSGAAGKSQEYARWVRQAYRLAPQHPRIRELHLQLTQSQEDPQKVIKQREQILASRPGDLVNLSRLAALYEQTDQLASAEQTYVAILRASRNSPSAIAMMADFLRRNDRDVEARKILAQYASTAPDKIVAYVLWATYLDRAGDTKMAEDVYRKALAVDPKNERPYLSLARFFARHRQWDKAIENQKKYIDLAGDKAPLRAQEELVGYLNNTDRFDEADAIIDGILEKDRFNVDILRLKGLAHLNRKEFDKAGEALDRALEIRPDDAQALVYRAEKNMAVGDKDAAVADLEAARRTGMPIRIVVQLAGLYETIGQYEKAATVLLSEAENRPLAMRALVQLHMRHRHWPAMEDTLVTARKTYPKDAFYPLMEYQMWRERGEPNRALRAAEAALKLSPDDARIAVSRMQALIDVGRLDDAISAGKDLRDDKVAGPSVMALTGLALARKNQESQADAEFTAAIKTAAPGQQLRFVLDQVRSAWPADKTEKKLRLWKGLRPDDVAVRQLLAELLQARGDYDAAVGMLNEALENARADRDKANVLAKKGLIFYAMRRYDDSVRTYQEALKIDPDHVEVLNNLAWLLAVDIKRPDQALPPAARAAKLMPNNVDILDTYGYVLVLEGNYDEARKVLSRSIDLRATPANRLHLGQAYERMKRRSDALRQYRLGLRLVRDDPKNQYYRDLADGVSRLGGAPAGSARP